MVAVLFAVYGEWSTKTNTSHLDRFSAPFIKVIEPNCLRILPSENSFVFRSALFDIDVENAELVLIENSEEEEEFEERSPSSKKQAHQNASVGAFLTHGAALVRIASQTRIVLNDTGRFTGLPSEKLFILFEVFRI